MVNYQFKQKQIKKGAIAHNDRESNPIVSAQVQHQDEGNYMNKATII